jgi:NAD(P)-dependent dehydrogenase (short-subunit alcohol dehydrogenase family)
MHVVLADIAPEGARETRRRIEEEEAPGSGHPARVDVTSERAVDELYEYVVRNLGGVDVLVNCAGIAPASHLVDFPVDAFRKTLEINLTGYFLMARGAARMMKRQGTGGSIINLSSKSGLDASKNNSAYNATKAGEIHLARGWAQELAEFGVRVNSVCPGNVFRESKIWNDEYIEVVAKKRGIEPDEVIPYYINLTALKEEIDWDDIADAVAFLSSPRASKITGQTLVVDAGQVFVR